MNGWMDAKRSSDFDSIVFEAAMERYFDSSDGDGDEMCLQMHAELGERTMGERRN